MEKGILMTKPIITKEHFVACINVLREGDDMARRINQVVSEYKRGDFIDGYAFSNTDTETKLIETLEIALGDENHWISWWCFETDYGRDSEFTASVNWNGETYNLDSPEKLYDFLTSTK
jgi:hypothetical protein